AMPRPMQVKGRNLTGLARAFREAQVLPAEGHGRVCEAREGTLAAAQIAQDVLQEELVMGARCGSVRRRRPRDGLLIGDQERQRAEKVEDLSDERLARPLLPDED